MKKLILLIVFIIVVICGWYAYHEFNRKNRDLVSVKADFVLQADSLIKAFQNDSTASNRKFTDKIIEVNGAIKQMDINGNPVIIFLGSGGGMSSVKCSMDSTHQEDYKNIKNGQNVIIKGKCTGGQTLDLFGTDVTLNYCVIPKK